MNVDVLRYAAFTDNPASPDQAGRYHAGWYWLSQTAQSALRPSACSSWKTCCICSTTLADRPGGLGGLAISCSAPSREPVVAELRGRLSPAVTVTGASWAPGTDRAPCRLAAARSATVATAAKKTTASEMVAIWFFMPGVSIISGRIVLTY
jgi:hypothetical protein